MSAIASDSASRRELPIQLRPSYFLPLVFAIAAVPLLWVQLWVALGVSLLGAFLLVQAATIRLQFTETALDVYRSETLLRHFPYQDWQSWRIFWPPVPILFYFKEVNSIHFLPILFEAKLLRTCLEQHCPISPQKLTG